jgi:hypothetical protein
MDRISSHGNKGVLAMLETGGIHRFFITPQASKYLSPCDNSFFSPINPRIWNVSRGTTEEKETLRDALHGEPARDGPGLLPSLRIAFPNRNNRLWSGDVL